MKSQGPSFELVMLEQKLKALSTLVRCEADPRKLDFYKQELASVAVEVNEVRNASRAPLVMRASA
jgi:hypothetical protein